MLDRTECDSRHLYLYAKNTTSTTLLESSRKTFAVESSRYGKTTGSECWSVGEGIFSMGRSSKEGLMGTRIASLVAIGTFLFSCGSAVFAESTQAKVARALSAAPANVAAHATVADMDAKGKLTVFRAGTNGFTCVPGHLGVVGDDPMCMDAPALVWAQDLAMQKPRPTNTKPGIIYMLAGGTDWSANDPFATKGTPIKEPPHWMIVWPFDAKKTGLPTTLRDTGTWIMYAGTPYAHLMINGKP